MNLLLVSANREPFPDPVFPLGLAYIAQAARLEGHTLHVLDLAFVKNPKKSLAGAVRSHRPDAVAFSFRNLDNAAWPLTRYYLPDYQDLVRTVRESGEAWIIAGGPAVSLMPEKMRAALDADFAIEGEGEEAFPALLAALEEGRSPAGIPGVFGKDLPPPDAFPVPDPPLFSSQSPPVPRFKFDGTAWSRILPARDLFAFRKYGRVGGMANIQTKRGCVFRCRYCTYPVLEGTSHRLRDPEAVADEIETIVRQDGIRSFFFVDSVFNMPASHATGVANALIRRKLRIRWSAYASPAGLTLPILRKMAEAGCDGLEIGTDSADQATLASLGKSFSRDQIFDVAEACRTAGIVLCHSLIFGGPGETPETVANTCRTIEETRPLAVVIMAGVRLYPRTPMGEWALAEGIVRSEEDLLAPTFYIAPAVRDFLVPYLEEFAAARGNWILPGIVPPIRPITQRIIRLAGYKKPLWHLLRYGVFKNRVYRDR